MKDNIDIDKLFKDKFEDFEPVVNNQVWQNIAQTMSTTATAATNVGMGVWLKSILIGTAATIIGVGTWIYFDNQTSVAIPENTKKETINKDFVQQPNKVNTETVNELAQELFEKKEAIETLDNQATNINNTLAEEIMVEESNVVNLNPVNKAENLPALEEPAIKNDLNNALSENEKIESEKISTLSEIKTYNGESKDTIEAINSFKPQEKIDGDQVVYEEVKVEKPTSSINTIPNVITPNNDRINDEFFINSENIETFYIVIYTPGNVKLYESNEPDFKWDGFDMKGNKVPRGNYYYLIKAVGKDAKAFSIPGQLSIQ